MNPESQEVTLNFRDLLAFVVRGALFAVLLAVPAAVVAFMLAERQPTVYRAEATLLVARAATGFTQFGLTSVMAPAIDMGAYRVAATSDQVLTDALAMLGVAAPTLSDVRSLRGRIGTSIESGVRDPSLLRIDGRGESAAAAATRANAVATALVVWDRRRASDGIERAIGTLTQQIEALSEQIRALQAVAEPANQSQIDGLIRLRADQQQQLAYARALVASAEGLLSVLQPADSTARLIAPRPVASATIAALVAAVLVYGLLLLRIALNTRLRGSDDVARVSGLPVLAEFPAGGRDELQPQWREAASYLRTNLLFATAEQKTRVFMVTSSVEHEGKTTVGRFLAEGFVRNGYRTLLVDCDLRAPSVASNYEVANGIPETATTESWLSDPAGSHHIVTVQLGPEDRLDVIPQLRRAVNAPELLGRGFRAVLERWAAYDIVVIDAPPVLAVADPLVIAPHCTGTIVVVDRQRTDRRKLSQAVGVLQRIGVQILGVVVNNESNVLSGPGYGEAYGHDLPRVQAEGRRRGSREKAPPTRVQPSRGSR